MAVAEEQDEAHRAEAAATEAQGDAEQPLVINMIMVRTEPSSAISSKEAVPAMALLPTGLELTPTTMPHLIQSRFLSNQNPTV